jgi:hypothetical protein
VRHTRWRPVSGTVRLGFDDVLVAASNAVARQRLDELEPWDLEQLKPYDPAYLAGFLAQRYQVDLADGLTRAHEVMAEAIHKAVRQDISGDEQRTASTPGTPARLAPVAAGLDRFKVWRKGLPGGGQRTNWRSPGRAALERLEIAGLVAVLAVILVIADRRPFVNR